MRTAALLSAVVGAAAAGDGPYTLDYTLNFVDLARYPLAVCNDGTPAAFYLHRGRDPTRWVVHQQGGWWCWDEYSCAVRWAHFATHESEKRTLMSTGQLANLTQLHDTFNGEKNTGIMQHNETTNPSLANASKVFLVYCSSDAHAGNISAGAGPGGSEYHFRGKEIVRAVIDTLASDHGLGAAGAFVLTGGSAGGMATINNADYVRELVHSVAPEAAYVAVPDSGYFLDVEPHRLCQTPDTYECNCAAGARAGTGAPPAGFLRDDGHAWLGTGQTLAQQAMAMRRYTGGIVDESCAAYYGEWGAWRCYLGQYAAPHLTSTTLFLQSQVDEWQGFWDGFSNYSHSAADYRYAEWFREASARALSESAAAPGVHVFAPNCYHHGLTYESIFWEVVVDGWSASGLLTALLSPDPAAVPPRAVIAGCAGVPCGAGHASCLPLPAGPPR